MSQKAEKVELLTSVVEISLSQSVVWEEQKIEKLSLNFRDLSGDDILNVESEFIDFIEGQKHVFVAFKTDHPSYLAVLAAKAAGVHPNLMKKLRAKDFLKVTGAAKRFLSSSV